MLLAPAKIQISNGGGFGGKGCVGGLGGLGGGDGGRGGGFFDFGGGGFLLGDF